MAVTTGIQPVADYTAGTNKQRIQRMIDLIPDPDTQSSSGATAGGGFLDEMSPVAAAGLRVELMALKAAVTD